MTESRQFSVTNTPRIHIATNTHGVEKTALLVRKTTHQDILRCAETGVLVRSFHALCERNCDYRTHCTHRYKAL